ncbi:MAG: DUF1080 domain-containing protein [Planctomycetaceae bacterium]|nr:DUF1080 domain-containing protein [Planctomycetaceae bacterium]
MTSSPSARLLMTLPLVALFLPIPARGEVPVNQLTDAEQRAGWKLLFDGKSAEGWRNYRKDKINEGWVVEDGALTRKGSGAGDIVTTGQFEHFELQLDYKISKGGNSGLMFHVTEDEATPWMTGPEVQIQDNVDGHDPQKAGWLYQLYQPMKPEWAKKFEAQVGFKGIDVDDATRPAGEWNQLYLRVDNKQGEVCVNGVSYYYFVKGSDDWNARVAKSKFAKMPKFGKPTKGHISLQDHGNLVSFRNIKVRELTPDGKAPEPVDGTLKVKAVPAFTDIEWEGWTPVNDNGLPNPPLRPIHVTHAGDGTHRLFFVDQSGMIHVVPKGGTKKAKLFADFRARTHQFKLDDEEGLLGFAFHPKFKENGQFFLIYNTESSQRTMYLSRFKVSKTDPDKADPDSEEILLTIKQPFANHNGGPMAFGPDGLLYIGMGDGGGRNDPTYQGQARGPNFLGAMFRIDVDHHDQGKKYAVPKDNPFLNEKDVPPETYAYGFRNPWRVAFDRKTGDLWLADVGQDLWEEIDIVKKGGNYGWSAWEGTHPFGNVKGSEKVKGLDPIWEYDHRLGKSITGGSVYRGKAIPELEGHYLYGDFVTGKIWGLKYDTKAGKVIQNMSIPWNGLPVMAFGEDEDGEMYVTTPSQAGKGVFKFVAAE